MMAPGAPPLILASGSAARRALLTAAGLRFQVQAADVNEAAIRQAMRDAGDGDAAALALASAKARQVAGSDALVIGADQMLLCEGRWFDKPPDMAAARAQLWALRGRRHELVTAATCWQAGREVWRHEARPALSMRRFSEAFVDAYLAEEGDTCLASVGAYRVEGPGLQLFDRIDGEHAAVLGLPLLALLAFLRESGVLLE